MTIRSASKPQFSILELLIKITVVLYSFTLLNWFPIAGLGMCLLQVTTGRKKLLIRVSNSFMIALALTAMFCLTYAPTLYRLFQTGAFYSLPLAWIGMLFIGYHLHNYASSKYTVLNNMLLFAVPLTLLLIYSIFLTLNALNATSMSDVVKIVHSRFLMDPYKGILVPGTSVGAFGALGIALIGIILFIPQGPTAKRIWLPVLIVAVVSTFAGLFIGNLYTQDFLNIKSTIESSYFAQRMELDPFTGGRIAIWSSSANNIGSFLFGGGDLGAHSLWLDILITGGITPFLFLCGIILYGLFEMLKFILQADVPIMVKYSMASGSAALITLMTLEPTLQGYPFVFCALFYSLGTLCAINSNPAPQLSHAYPEESMFLQQITSERIKIK